MNQFDVLLVGGGLQSGLIAAAISHHWPDRTVLILERDDALGGNHTWSFHPDDVPESARPWIDPMVDHRWNGYEVRLRNFRRKMKLSYASIPSQTFADHVRSLPGVTVRTGQTVTTVDSHRVVTSGGETFDAALVIDNRGPRSSVSINPADDPVGFQKFWGFEIELDSAWPIDGPIVMDDAVDQADGFRFVYSLPFTERRVLVEDTRFSNSPDVDRDECLATTRDYLRSIGVDSFRIVREESGVLPMPFGAIDFPRRTTPLSGGYAGGWFHAATGYSFPMAVAFASTVAMHDPADLPAAIERLARDHQSRAKFARLLNRLLFRLVAPEKRYQIFRRFYRVLSEARIARFYAHRFTAGDAARIVVGMPPGGLRPIRFLRSFVRRRVHAASAVVADPVSTTRSLEGAP